MERNHSVHENKMMILIFFSWKSYKVIFVKIAKQSALTTEILVLINMEIPNNEIKC